MEVMSVLPPPTNERYNTSLLLLVLRVIVIVRVWPLLLTVFVDAEPSNAGGAFVTLKVPLVPVLLEPDVEIVIPEPAPVTVTKPVQTPLEKAPVVVGLIVPVETLKVLVVV
jgi:hypothetical protein